MIEVNKKELAREIGKTGAIVTKLAKEGVLDGCFTPTGKIDLEGAIKAIIKVKGADYLGGKYKEENIPFFQLSDEQRDKFKTDFTKDMFDYSELDENDYKDFVTGLDGVNADDTILRDFADVYPDVFERALDFSMSIKDVEDFYFVKFKG